MKLFRLSNFVSELLLTVIGSNTFVYCTPDISLMTIKPISTFGHTIELEPVCCKQAVFTFSLF